MDKKKRSYLKKISALAVISPFAINTNLNASQKVSLRLSTAFPKKIPGLGTGLEFFVKTVKKLSEGNVEIKIFDSGLLSKPFDTLKLVKEGGADLGYGAPYYWSSLNDGFNFAANYPFGLTAEDFNSWYYFGKGKAIIRKLYEKYNTVFFLCGNTGHQMGGWFKKKINSLDDLKNLKYRIPGIGGKILSKYFGVNVINLPGSEVLQALASGAIDATEWNNPYGEATIGFANNAKYYYHPGWHEVATVIDLFANKKTFDNLSFKNKEIIEISANVTNHMMINEFNYFNSIALDKLKQNFKNIKILRFPDNILTSFKEKSEQFYKNYEFNEFSKEIYYSSLNFKKLSKEWFRISRKSYTDI